MNEKLIGIREACELLDVNIKTLRAWTDKGKIEAVRTGSRIHELTTLDIDVDSMYEYKQHKQSTTMLTCGILL